MASNYPGSLDSFDTIASDKKTSDAVGGRTHRQMHNDLGDAVEAVQAELGTDPAGTFSTVKARLDALVAYAAKTSAYTATVADRTLNVTSGTFTLDLPAASTCTGQSLKVKNSGTGVVTLDGNSAETVEGVATFPLGPRSYVEVTSTGSAWIVTGGTPDTGWRDLSAVSLSNGWAVNAGQFFLRRRGNLVSLTMFAAGASASASAVWTPLPGYAPVVRAIQPSASSTSAIGNTIAVPGGDLNIYGYTTATYYVGLSWPTDDSWPTSLPGTAAV